MPVSVGCSFRREVELDTTETRDTRSVNLLSLFNVPFHEDLITMFDCIS